MKIQQRIALKRFWRFLLITFIFCIPLLGETAVALPRTILLTSSQINQVQGQMQSFVLKHQNAQSGIFIEPTLATNFYGMCDNTTNVASLPTLDFDSNTQTLNEALDFLYYYFAGKQNFNTDGGFSDVGGLSTMAQTYDAYNILNQIIGTNQLDVNTSVNTPKMEMIKIYLENSITGDGWGFASQAIPETIPSLSNVNYNGTGTFNGTSFNYTVTQSNLEQSDIQSTAYGCQLSNLLDFNTFNQTNMIAWIQNCYRPYLTGGGYTQSNDSISITPDPASTYYGIMANLLLNHTYSISYKDGLEWYLNDLAGYDGGYSSSYDGPSDLLTTYYVVASLAMLNSLSTVSATQLTQYVIKCQNPNGGFGPVIYNASAITGGEINYTAQPTFQDGWAAMQIFQLLNATIPESVLTAYQSWKQQDLSIAGFFGYPSVEAQYLGVQSLIDLGYNDISSLRQNITNYINNCSNVDGGYGSLPGANSSLYTTFCAVQAISLLNQNESTYFLKNSPFANASMLTFYISGLQNNATDNGFRMGNITVPEIAADELPEVQMVYSLGLQNDSTTEATYWALASLESLNRTNAVNLTGAALFLLCNQAPDGGFSGLRSYRSDMVSTYYAYMALQLLNLQPYDTPKMVEFIKDSQIAEGTFVLNPLITEVGFIDPYVSITYSAWLTLSFLGDQPINVNAGVQYFFSCFDPNTFGLEDLPGAGADLRNMVMGATILQPISAIYWTNPRPFEVFFSTIFIVELFGLAIVLLVLLFIAIWRRLSRTTEKLNKEKDFLIKFPAVEVEDLTVSAGGKTIINKMSLRLSHGEILGVLGESGAGKSTFVKALLGMREYTGKIRIYGYDPKKEGKRLKHFFGYVPQDLSKLYENFTVMENLVVFGQQYGIPHDVVIERGKLILRSLQIAQKENELVNSLSGGQKRRVSIAIALIHEPILCILDEPTSGLDPVVREELWLSLVELNERLNTTLIVITHYPEESRYCNKVAIFARKKGMIDYGTPNDLLALLPGAGRAIEMKFRTEINGAAHTLMTIPDVDKVLERNLGQEFVIFSNLTIAELQNRVEQTIPEATIDYIGQTDARMEDFFRYRFLEVII